jgi:hypothetical protein
MRIRNILLAALVAGVLAPAAASAQDTRWGRYDGPPPPPAPALGFVRYGPPPPPGPGPDVRILERESRLEDWMRRGSHEGWLVGWRARRAWGDLRSIKAETHGGYGFDAYRVNRRLDRLSDFVRRAHDAPWG